MRAGEIAGGLRGVTGAAAAALIALGLAAAPRAGAAAEPAPAYPRMAPIEAYLMDRAEEIALARSAAPAAVSKDATVLVLTRTGYETAVTGTNGFVCVVGRGFSGAPDWPERWDPRIKAAECQNPAAARTMEPIAMLRTRLLLAGTSEPEILAAIRTALSTKAIPPLEAGSMSYMMSRNAYLSAQGDHDMPHVMFFAPVRDGASWGANAKGSPFFGGSYWYLTAGHAADEASLPPISVLLMGAATWSDGTPGPMHAM